MSVSNFKNKISGYKPVNVNKKGKRIGYGLYKFDEKWKSILSNGVAERSNNRKRQLNYLDTMAEKEFIKNNSHLLAYVKELKDKLSIITNK